MCGLALKVVVVLLVWLDPVRSSMSSFDEMQVDEKKVYGKG